MTCARCHDTRWTCEEHPDKPMGHDGCKGTGDPCPDCNPQSAEKVPTLPGAVLRQPVVFALEGHVENGVRARLKCL